MTSPDDPTPDPTEVYTAGQVDTLLDGYYSRDDVDALLDALQRQIDGKADKPVVQPPVVVAPPVAHKALVGSGDMSAFKGLLLGAHRTYYGFESGAGKGFSPKLMAANLAADAAAGRRSYVSIGPGHSVPTYPKTMDSRAGQYVAALKENAGNVVLLGRHEPGNKENPKGTPAEFAAWQNICLDYYHQALGDDLLTGMCFMAWTARGKITDLDPYLAGIKPGLIQEFTFDCYSHDNKIGVMAIPGVKNCITKARQLRVPWAICETGREAWLDQAAYLASIDAMIADPVNSDCKAVMYWNGGNVGAKPGTDQHNYRLTSAGLAAFQGLTNKHAVAGLKAV